MVGCVLSQLKPEDLYILRKRPRPKAEAVFEAKNVEILGLYSIHNHFLCVMFAGPVVEVRCCRAFTTEKICGP